METINVQREPFLTNDVVKIFCKLYVKNIDIFVKLHIQQSKDMLSTFNSASMYNYDAGDVYQLLRMSHGSSSNKVSNNVLKDTEFSHLLLSFTQELESMKSLTTFTDQYETPIEKMWEVCRCFIIPVRIAASTIASEERERILRLWLSTVFTLPLLEGYNEKFYPYHQKAILAIRNFVKTATTPSDQAIYNDRMLHRISTIDDKFIDMFVSPIRPTDSDMDTIMRTSMYLVLMASIDVIRKPCPNLKACKGFNPDYDGACIHILDEHVNDQIKKIQKMAETLKPK